MERKSLRLLVLCCLFIVTCGCVSAQAIDPVGGFYSGANDLVTECRAALRSTDSVGQPDTPDLIESQTCAGYVTGVLDTFELEKTFSHGYQGQSLCIPEAVRSNQAIKIFLKYSDDHPEKLHLAAPIVLWNAMHQAFPCPAASK